MGNKNICCNQEEQQRQSQTLGSELKQFLSFSWHARVNEIINRDYNNMPLLNDYKVSPTLQTIQLHLHIKNQMLSDIFYSFVQNSKEMLFHSQMKISFFSTSIIVSDSSFHSLLAQSFIKATDVQIVISLSSSHLDLKLEINQFIHFFADLILKFYKSKFTIDKIKMLILDELFGNESFYDFVKKQYDIGLHSKIIAYRTYIQKKGIFKTKQEKAVVILQSMVTKRSPKEKLKFLDMAAQELTNKIKNVDADKFNELVFDLIIQANIPSLVTEIKMIHHFAGEINPLGRYGYVLTSFMGVLMLILQNYEKQ